MPKTFVATIGFFDGVHAGHRFLLQILKDEASRLGKQSLVISFQAHPKSVLSADTTPPLLTLNEEKIEMLSEFGIDACVLLPFDKEMAALSAYDFFKQLIFPLGVGTLFIGFNHRFGKNRAEGIDDYIRYGQELGITIQEASSFTLDTEKVSSSIIRNLILNGQLEKAATFLSYPYFLKGEVVSGNKIGNTIGFPTANIELTDCSKLLPPNGVYAVTVEVQKNRFWGMLNIGYKPTIGSNNKKTIEVHIIDFNESIYGEKICVTFIKKIREEKKFSSINALQNQLKQDKEFVIQLKNNTTR
ncbi:MAG: riboflavin biosynthesis protein RibF [Paludibacteraceae bacterium]|nr:riboflavin biosynthesis protein RibF [Paludibacteraceae bacterium]MBN2787304.1 riboflavin biosynthesis protein RibF [Paludibacteraceae bacterium]